MLLQPSVNTFRRPFQPALQRRFLSPDRRRFGWDGAPKGSLQDTYGQRSRRILPQSPEIKPARRFWHRPSTHDVPGRAWRSQCRSVAGRWGKPHGV